MEDRFEIRYDDNITFTFVGRDYVPYSPAHITADPYYSVDEEGGYFEDYDILLGDTDVTEILSDDVIEEVVRKAEEERGSSDYGAPEWEWEEDR